MKEDYIFRQTNWRPINIITTEDYRMRVPLICVIPLFSKGDSVLEYMGGNDCFHSVPKEKNLHSGK